MFNTILVVCTGNICRSPVAEYLLRQELESSVCWEGRVVSAGIGALVNHPADETAQAMMQARGLDLGAHRATQLTIEHLRQADLVLVMEKHHRQAIFALDPTARGKTFLLGHWIDGDIPDPYQRGEQAHTDAVKLIDAAIKPWLGKLTSAG
ncbi:phosphotyrosine-protein phosphatase [Candidatus Accumulibacter aalborgensis]|uniref:protein-tyrosine-phosphatase n=1 Tax=Candidatus Accumulibacter aalborgensis TaxID=1860102 RepID=A0A1A8XVK9_9PROT|nr:low molecular weight protein-tyrosine-phosphatase [Candidatus Accumulibacter aalborgensis]SBT08622.1 phosphotyrosine-protein phosphatase [Candidatus Accumulibacter aalborgensis]